MHIIFSHKLLDGLQITAPILKKCLPATVSQLSISTSSCRLEKKSYRLVIVGGGTGGCSMAAKFARKFDDKSVAVIEPSESHYYQPMWTLVGRGIKTLEQSKRPMASVIPNKVVLIKDKVASFKPEESELVTEKGDEISYEYLIIALGLQLDFDLVKGLPEALKTDPAVCSNYSSNTVNKTFQAMKNFNSGNAIFTYPNTPVKCAGAPQKIMYLAEDYFRTNDKRKGSKVIYNTSLDVIFGVKKYANELKKIINMRNIDVNFKRNLIEVRPSRKEAVFEVLGVQGDPQLEVYNYDMLHVTPPMSAPDVLKKSTLSDKTGFLDVDKRTLQHVKYRNIFGIGDCTNLPTSRTAAAVAAESGVVRRNLERVMEGLEPNSSYDGYTSCPLVTKIGKCILAEFDYDLQPLETFPINQGKERWSMYTLKKEMMPQLYWEQMLKGRWEGPQFLRKLLHFGFSR